MDDVTDPVASETPVAETCGTACEAVAEETPAVEAPAEAPAEAEMAAAT